LATWNPQALADLSVFNSSQWVRLASPVTSQTLRKLVGSEQELALLIQTLNPGGQLAAAFTAPSQAGSRFRRWFDAGVIYGSRLVKTSMAETGYHRWKFLTESPDLVELRVSMAEIWFDYRGLTLDITRGDFDPHRSELEHLSDYRVGQELALNSREASINGIKFASVRDFNRGDCLAALTLDSLSEPTWGSWFSLHISLERVEFRTPDQLFEFDTLRWS
jgi:hypothetical protein